MKYALMLPEYNVKKAEKELQDFKDNKINLLTNKEARKNKVEKVAKGTGEVVKEAIVCKEYHKVNSAYQLEQKILTQV